MPWNIKGNPYLSEDREFIDAFAKELLGEGFDPAHVRAALFSVYEEHAELGIFALRLDDASSAEEAKTILIAQSEGAAGAMTFQTGNVVVLLWHDGVSDDCFAAINDYLENVMQEDAEQR